MWEVNSKHRGLDIISKRQGLWGKMKGKYSTVKCYGKMNFTLRLKSQRECKVTQA